MGPQPSSAVAAWLRVLHSDDELAGIGIPSISPMMPWSKDPALVTVFRPASPSVGNGWTANAAVSHVGTLLQFGLKHTSREGRIPMSRIIIGLLAMAAVAGAEKRPVLSIEPREALVDEIAAIRASGLAPDARYTLRASMVDANGRVWRSETPFRANGSGSFDFGRNPSPEAVMRPFWAMQLAPDTPPERRAPPRFARPTAGCFEVHLEVAEGQATLASATAKRCMTKPEVSVSEVREHGLVGRIYEPKSPGRHAAILVLTGSNGGIPDHHAGLLASRGYVTFALAYFRVDPLPKDLLEIPIEYFETAIEWLRARKSVDPSRLGIIGNSKGGELAVLLPALERNVFRAAVALAPSAYVWEGAIRDPAVTGIASIKSNRSSWSYHGKPLPFVTKVITADTKRRIQQDGSVDTIEFYRPALDDETALAPARIPVENIATPLLLVSSSGDRMWPSSIQAEQVCTAVRRLKRICDHLQYEEAGHLILEPWLPVAYGIFPAGPGRWDKASLGGTAEGTAHAEAESWPKILRFFDDYLGR